MSELPPGVPAARVPEPRDSASGILVRNTPEGIRVLLGLRSRRSRFMPGHLAFPGGAMDAQDRPREPGAFRRCLVREIEEECGLSIGASAWIEAGERTTPPIFPVRFRTRFYVAELEGDPPSPASPENEELVAALAGDVVEDWAAGRVRVPPPVLPILRALHESRPEGAPAVAAAVAAANREEEIAPRIEFVPDVWCLPLPTATLPPATHTNCFLVGGEEFVVIDPAATDAATSDRLAAVVARRERAGGRATAVILSHHHRDHLDGSAAFARRLGLPLAAHPETLSRLGEPEEVELRPLDDDTVLELAGLECRVLHTPGHAIGHLAFHVPKHRALLASDLTSGLSTILIDPETGDMDAYLASLERVRRLDCRHVFPSHGPPQSGKELDRLLAHRRRRERLVLELLQREGRAPLAAVAEAAYAETPGLPAPLIRGQTLSHLRRLAKLGQVAEVSGQWHHLPGGETAARIETLLRDALAPRTLKIHDDSARHVGHAGAVSGGGHYRLFLVADEFEGMSALARHRRVYAVLGELMPERIHALSMELRSPAEAAG